MRNFEALVCLWVHATTSSEAHRLLAEQAWLNKTLTDLPNVRYRHSKVIPINAMAWHARLTGVRQLGVLPYLDHSWENISNKPLLGFAASVLLELEALGINEAVTFIKEAPWFLEAPSVTFVNASRPAALKSVSTRITAQGDVGA